MRTNRRVNATLVGVVVLAVLVRLSRWPTPRALLLGGGEYDPAVMYLASASFVNGLMPYRDFTFLHPPGVLLGLAPAVLVAETFGDAAGLATARIVVVLLGGVNAGLVALLLKRYGASPMLLGGGLYAAWSALAYTEQQPLLEPFLTTALLVALHLNRSRHPRAPFGMGLILGVATMVKVWAAVDLIVFVVVFIVQRRFRDVGRFTLGAAVGGSAIALPFFMTAPGIMWEMVVTAQVSRPSAGVDLLTRAAMFGPAPYLDHPVYVAGMTLTILTLLGVAAVLILRVCTHSPVSSEAAREGALWASFALTHALVMAMSGSFYDHYAMFVAAPLTLVVGAAAANVRERIDLDGARITAAVTVVILLVGGASVAGSLHRVATTDHMKEGERLIMARWADEHACTFASVSDRVLIDEGVDALERGCPITVDPFGETLLAQSREAEHPGPASPDPAMIQFLESDGLVLPIDETRWSLPAEIVKRHFVPLEEVGRRVLWVKAGTDG